jgi:hypothetical protein
MTNDDAHDNLARHLAALKKALHCLDEYEPQANYIKTGLPSHNLLAPETQHGICLSRPIFPYPVAFTHYGCADNKQTRFTYEATVEGRALLFRGKMMNDDRHICIKFVRRYGKDVHLWCANEGFAPRLIAFERLPGGWYMVVMEFLDTSWKPIAEMARHPAGLKEKIHAAITKLHQNHMVHGDLRDTNVLVKQDGGTKFMLVDYDWAGYEGEVTYPRHVNKRKELGRPDEVEDGIYICSHHDILMLEHLFH